MIGHNIKEKENILSSQRQTYNEGTRLSNTDCWKKISFRCWGKIILNLDFHTQPNNQLSMRADKHEFKVGFPCTLSENIFQNIIQQN